MLHKKLVIKIIGSIIVALISGYFLYKSNEAKTSASVGSQDSGSNTSMHANRDIVQAERDNILVGRDFNQTNIIGDTTHVKSLPPKRRNINEVSSHKKDSTSANVSINQGDNSLAIVGNNNSVNTSEPQRHPSQLELDIIQQRIPKDADIEIFATLGDSEAANYLEELTSLLEELGYSKLSPTIGFLAIKPMKGSNFKIIDNTTGKHLLLSKKFIIMILSQKQAKLE